MAAIIATNAQVIRPSHSAQPVADNVIDIAIKSSNKPALLEEIHGKSSSHSLAARFAQGATHEHKDAVDSGMNRLLVNMATRSLHTADVRAFGSLQAAAKEIGLIAA